MTCGPYCKGCVLEKLGQGFARTDGKGEKRILAVAEALGREEAIAKRPLVGAAGKVFDRIVYRTIDPDTKLPLKRDDFVLANVVNCRPPDNNLVGMPYEDAAIAQCSPYLVETLERVKPKAILAMGGTALKWFTQESGIESLRGYVFDTKWGPVIPTYHPSYIQRGNWHLVRVVQLDILKALHVTRYGKPTFKKNYISHPTVQQAKQFREDYFAAGCPLLAFDLETPYIGSEDKDEDVFIEKVEEDDASYTILMCSLSFREGEAITFPWMQPFISILMDILGSNGPKTGWNIRGFDIKRLVANGVPVNGRIYDGMDAWHFLEPGMPMGLKFAATFHCPDMSAWRLMAKKDKSWYCAADSDTALRVLNAVRKNLERENRWTTFERHFVDLGLVLDHVTLRGINVDRELRKTEREKFHQDFLNTVAELQPLVPQTVKPRHFYKTSKELLMKQEKWVEGEMVLEKVSISPDEMEKLLKKQRRAEEREVERLRKLELRAQRAEQKALKAALRSSSSSRRKGKTSSSEKTSESTAKRARRKRASNDEA